MRSIHTTRLEPAVSGGLSGAIVKVWSTLWRWLRPPRRVRPTKVGWTLIGILLALLFGALNSGNNLLYLLLSLLFALVALSGVLSEYSVRRVHVSFQIPDVATAGEPFTFLARFENRSRRQSAYLLTGDPAGLAPKGALSIPAPAWIAYLPPAGAESPGAQSLWQKAVAPRRGIIEIKEAYLATRGPFGLFDRRKRVPCGARIAILPAPVETPLPGQTPPSAQGALPLPRPGEGFDLRSLRFYETGDPARKIAWRASARSGQTMVRQMDEETHRRMAVALDPSALDFDAKTRQAGVARYLAESLLQQGYEVKLLIPGSDEPEGYAATPEDLLLQLLPLASWDGRGTPWKPAGTSVLRVLASAAIAA